MLDMEEKGNDQDQVVLVSTKSEFQENLLSFKTWTEIDEQPDISKVTRISLSRIFISLPLIRTFSQTNPLPSNDSSTVRFVWL